MKEFTVDIKRTITLTEEDVEDLVVTALEGGIGYWACLDNRGQRFKDAPKDEPVSITASKILMDGGDLMFLDNDDRRSRWSFSIGKLMEGIKLYIEQGHDVYNVFSGDEVDMGMCDVECADIIFQLGMFGELVYG